MTDANSPSHEEDAGRDIRAMETPELEELAQSILRERRRLRPSRPVIIEFAGSPKSGKSSGITSLATFLKRCGFRVQVIHEHASVSPIERKTDWLFNVWTSAGTVQQLAHYMTLRTASVDVVLLDRGLFDALCWLRWFVATKRMEARSAKSMRDFLTIERFRGSIDLVFAFTADPQKSMERELANLLTSRYGKIMNPIVLDEFFRAVNDTVREHRSAFKAIQELNTSATEPKESAKLVVLAALGALRRSVLEEVGFVDRSQLRSAFGAGLVSTFSNLLKSRIQVSFESRRVVEQNLQAVQPIPVAVITNKDRNRVFAVRKAEKSLGEHSPESERTLLYLGGHVRADDAFDRSRLDLLAIFENTLRRELEEEIGAGLLLSADEPFCIWDRNGPVKSQQHMAVVFVCEIDLDRLEPTMDPWEFDAANDIPSYEVLGVEEIDRRDLEAWSAAILLHLFGREGQEELPMA